ncbi:hypothetical protein NKG94_00155 [Micromonospora sp. M12]
MTFSGAPIWIPQAASVSCAELRLARTRLTSGAPIWTPQAAASSPEASGPRLTRDVLQLLGTDLNTAHLSCSLSGRNDFPPVF